jgi:hypothetical protein
VSPAVQPTYKVYGSSYGGMSILATPISAHPIATTMIVGSGEGRPPLYIMHAIEYGSPLVLLEYGTSKS